MPRAFRISPSQQSPLPQSAQKSIGPQPLRARVVRSTTTVEATGFSPWNQCTQNQPGF
ncbi:MAG TPA: hypothetical protein VIY53_03115 [Acidobacteriaceae bacterium]